MKTDSSKKKGSIFERFSTNVTKATGSTYAFIIALGMVIAWAVSGPKFNFSETWQLVINTGTTIITFLMVFLIQKSQNKDSLSIHLKLDELVAAHERASNRLVDVENMTEDELKILQKHYQKLSTTSNEEASISESITIDEIDIAPEDESTRHVKRAIVKEKVVEKLPRKTNNNTTNKP